MKKRYFIFLIISVPVFTLSSCTMKAIDIDPTTTIEVPETMPTVTLAPDDGSIPDLESLEAKGNEDSKESSAEDGSESKEQDPSALGGGEDVLPTATPKPVDFGEESKDPEGGDGPTGSGSSDPGVSPTEVSQATATPTQTPAATQTPTPQQTTSPQATQSPQQTTTPQATQQPQSTQTPAATQQPQATQTPSGGGDQGSQQASSHKHEWVPLYALSHDYLGNCQWQDEVMYKCYGCGETKQEKAPIQIVHSDHHDDGLNMVEVKPTCTTGGYSDCDTHIYCDCGYIDRWEHIHWDLDPLGHAYNHVVNFDQQMIQDGHIYQWYQEVCGNCGHIGAEGWEDFGLVP